MADLPSRPPLALQAPLPCMPACPASPLVRQAQCRLTYQPPHSRLGNLPPPLPGPVQEVTTIGQIFSRHAAEATHKGCVLIELNFQDAISWVGKRAATWHQVGVATPTVVSGHSRPAIKNRRTCAVHAAGHMKVEQARA